MSAFFSALLPVLLVGFIGGEQTERNSASQPADGKSDAIESLTAFEKRILPIFQSAKPSSCAECHLSGVDLKDYIRETQEETFQSLVRAGDRPIFGKGRLWQHSLSLTAPRASPWAEQIGSQRLPPGRYLVKLYIDQNDKLGKDFTAEMGQEEFVGQVEVESEWPSGYNRMTVVKFPE